MRQTHLAGDKMFVDYAGHTIPITNVVTGAVWQAQLFVAVLGASNYTFTTATATQTSADWIDAHVRALNFFGGVPILIVPDNARALIAAPDRYEPKVGLAYAEFAAHYGAAILPARPYKPQDKGKVEVAVQITERWILAVLRHRQFFSLDELNAAIAELMMSLNLGPFRKLPGSRLAAYLSLDYPALQLRPLPVNAYEFATFKRVRISLDYHVDIDHHGYSVPYRYANLDVDIRISTHTIECFYGGVRIACHRRVAYGGKCGAKLGGTLGGKYQYDGANNALNARTTVAEHMPKAHRAHREWTPLGLTAWAKTIGLSTHQIVTHVLQTKPHPEMGYRACLGLMHLERTYGAVRLEAACRHAVAVQVMDYKSVANVLKSGLDRMVVAQCCAYCRQGRGNPRCGAERPAKQPAKYCPRQPTRCCLLSLASLASLAPMTPMTPPTPTPNKTHL